MYQDLDLDGMQGHAALDYVESAVLQDDERIAWKGRPSPAACARVGLPRSAVGLAVFAFACFWTVGFGGLFALLGVPLFAFAAWLLSTSARYYGKGRRTYYAITGRRILIVTAGIIYRTHSIAPSDIADYLREARPDGRGDIRLRRTERGRSNYSVRWTEFADGLWGVADVKGAADAIAAIR